MARKPPRRTAASSQFSYAPRAPLVPRAPFTGPLQSGRLGQLGNTSYSSRAPSPAYNPVASTASSINPNIPSATPSQAPDITSSPDYLTAVANIQQYYGTESAKYTTLSEQDKLAVGKAQQILGVDPTTGGFKASNYGTSGTLNEGNYYRDVQNAKTAANKAGLFYSGQLGQNLGDIATDYNRKNTELVTGLQNRQAARDIERQTLETQYGAGGIKYREAANAAAAAQAQADQDAADRGAWLASLQGPAAQQLAGNTASAYAGNRQASPFTSGHLQGPRGEPIFTRNGKYYYKRASDGQIIPWGR